jgi:hypothetical protein
MVVALALAGIAPAARATPANKAAVERHFGEFMDRQLRNCSLCHLAATTKEPESIEEIPHNPFGDALAKAGRTLRAAGKKREMPARVELVAQADSDGDGAANLVELLLGRNPGDPRDRPAPSDLQTLSPRQAGFAAFLKSYRWEPFEIVKRPPVPTPANPQPGGNAIDAFLDEQRAARGLVAVGEAPGHVLLRRVYLDLIGLQPTPDEIAAFERDASPDAYEKVVDRLLADPRHGQRWARHWMDVWRYSDWAGWTDGGQIRDSQPHIWRWRDWIVDSLNADKGYDRMVLEMLAADELAPDDDAALRATGFLARNFKMLSREQWLEDTVNHTSRALLGVTAHCAKCHDHMFDPVSQEEYYRLRAIFEPHNVRIDLVPNSTDKKKDGLPRAYDKDLAAKTMFFVRGDERTPDEKRGAVAPGVPAFLGGELKIEPVKLPTRAARPDRRPFVREALLAEARATLDAARKKHQPAKDDAKATDARRAEAEAAIALAESKAAALAAVLKAEELEDAGKKERDDWKAAARDAVATQRRAAVAQAAHDLITAQNAADDARTAAESKDKAAAEKGAKDLSAARAKITAAQKALAAATAELGREAGVAYKPRPTDDYPDQSTGRRLAFARWVASDSNPLTARVAVNHIWARHFAQGLVPSVDDFGRNGRPATHPALLDWLAAELTSPSTGSGQGGWRMKHVHRLIVTSRAYRMTSAAAGTATESNLARDPDDVYLWRFPAKRMEAELVRDNVLHAAGKLDCAPGGPEIDHAHGLTSPRRSLYLRIAPEKEVEFLKVFDGPNPNECYFRRPSVMPQQALALGNSQLVVGQARELAASLEQGAGNPDNEAFVRCAFLRVLARPATDAEAAACREYLSTFQGDARRAREQLVVVLFNHNDFVAVR